MSDRQWIILIKGLRLIVAMIYELLLRNSKNETLTGFKSEFEEFMELTYKEDGYIR